MSRHPRKGQHPRGIARRDNCLRNVGIVIGNWSPTLLGSCLHNRGGRVGGCRTERERLLCLLLLRSIG
eukprot:3101959-Prymnesium_polylepis.1